MTDVLYVHREETHNLLSPGEIVPELMTLFSPSSVVDVGCGVGTFLHVFKQNGVKEVLGIDGEWANKDLLKKYLDTNEFIEHNVDISINLDKKFDLAICLEVGEHLYESKADILLGNLTRLSDVIVFSAAVPGQEGQHHVNEQWQLYWINKFEKLGYAYSDILAATFWNNSNVQWWYRQNMFIVIKMDKLGNYPQCIISQKKFEYIHPACYLNKLKKLEMIESGRFPFKSYIKFLLRNLGILK